MNTQITPEQAIEQLAEYQFKQGYSLSSLHPYIDMDGKTIFWRPRLEHPNREKWIRPMYFDEHGKYHLSEPPNLKLKPIYGLYSGKSDSSTLIIVEGEKPADTLNTFFSAFNVIDRFQAITSGSSTSYDKADWQSISNRACIIWPDNDEAGSNYAQNVYLKLQELGCSVSILDISHLSLDDGGDCVDWINNNPDVTIDDFIALLCVIRIEPPITTNRAVHVPHSNNNTLLTNHDPFEDPEPWDSPIIPSEIILEVYNQISRFVACTPETALAAALWIIMTWFIDEIKVCPLAAITAPEKRCGKTVLLSMIGKLVKRPLKASNISPAALFRTIDLKKPTLLIDEADTFFKKDEELRGILNSGHTRDTAYVIRLVGREHEPKSFCVWGAKAIAGIGELSDTLMDRSIRMELRRRLSHEKIERLRDIDDTYFKNLKSKLARFSMDHKDIIKNSRPKLPDELNDRSQDNWEPLIAIAELGGDDILKQAYQAAMASSQEHYGESSESIELLLDIRKAFKSSDRIQSEHLISELCADSDRPWATFDHGNKITPRQVIKLLSQFKISSKTVRFGATPKKGYLLSQFADIFDRYLPKVEETELQYEDY